MMYKLSKKATVHRSFIKSNELDKKQSFTEVLCNSMYKLKSSLSQKFGKTDVLKYMYSKAFNK